MNSQRLDLIRAGDQIMNVRTGQLADFNAELDRREAELWGLCPELVRRGDALTRCGQVLIGSTCPVHGLIEPPLRGRSV